MILVAKSMRKVILEAPKKEVLDRGFDFIWDKIREVYPSTKYKVFSIGSNRENEDIIFFELVLV